MSELLVSRIRVDGGLAQIDYNELANLPVVDSELSATSQNAIQNSTVTKKMNELKECSISLYEDEFDESREYSHHFIGNGENGKVKLKGRFKTGVDDGLYLWVNDKYYAVYIGAERYYGGDDYTGSWATFILEDGTPGTTPNIMTFTSLGEGGSGKIKVFESGSQVGKAVLAIEDGILVIREV